MNFKYDIFFQIKNLLSLHLHDVVHEVPLFKLLKFREIVMERVGWVISQYFFFFHIKKLVSLHLHEAQ